MPRYATLRHTPLLTIQLCTISCDYRETRLTPAGVSMSAGKLRQKQLANKQAIRNKQHTVYYLYCNSPVLCVSLYVLKLSAAITIAMNTSLVNFITNGDTAITPFIHKLTIYSHILRTIDPFNISGSGHGR